MFSVEEMDSRAKPLNRKELRQFTDHIMEEFSKPLDWDRGSIIHDDGEEDNPYLVLGVQPCWIAEEGDCSGCSCDDCRRGKWTHGDWGYAVHLHNIKNNEEIKFVDTTYQMHDAWRCLHD